MKWWKKKASEKELDYLRNRIVNLETRAGLLELQVENLKGCDDNLEKYIDGLKTRLDGLAREVAKKRRPKKKKKE